MKFSPHRLHPSSKIRLGQDGYVLLALLLTVTLMIVAAAAVLPSIAFQIRRDREEELIHRGVQYSRAIRAYYKKLGRYPAKLDDLESANNLRFLRKRYKDPITGKDFKLLHFGEVKMTFGAPIAGASPIAGTNASGFGGASAGAFGPSNGPGITAQSGFGASTPPATTVDPNAQPGSNQAAGTDPSQSSGAIQGQPGGQQVQAGNDKNDKNEPNGPVFGGAPIVGVVSTSKKDSIREFNHKRKYEEWQFIYDPANDRGGLLSTPNQPPLQGFGNQLGQPGQPGQPGEPNQNTSPFGSPQPPPGSSSSPNPPPNNPQQQQ